jgi:hypothetical protein
MKPRLHLGLRVAFIAGVAMVSYWLGCEVTRSRMAHEQASQIIAAGKARAARWEAEHGPVSFVVYPQTDFIFPVVPKADAIIGLIALAGLVAGGVCVWCIRRRQRQH